MKSTTIKIIGCFILSAALTACSTSSKIAALKPDPNYSSEIVYDKQESYVNLPLEIQVADLQNQTNKYLNGLVYEDQVLEDDQVMLKVWKEAPILIQETNGKLEMALPLKVWAKVRYGVEKFGFSIYDTREVNLNGIVRLNSAVSIQNWKLITNTQIKDIDWVESPSVVVAGKNIPVTYLINPVLPIFKTKIAKKVDEAIAKSLDIKPYVFNAIEQLSKPIQVNPEYKVWLGIQPLALYASPTVVANKKISLNMGMKAYLETAINSQPTLKFDRNQLVLQPAPQSLPEFKASVAGVVTYANAAALMQQNFAGQKFESGKRSVTVNKIDLWGKDGKLIVALNMSGSVNGDFYLSGTPKYNADKKEIYLDEVDFVLDSKNKLLKLGDWLVHGIIAQKIQQSCTFSIADQLNNGQKTMANYLSNYQPIKGIKVNGAMNNLTPAQIFLTPQAIVTMIVAKGKVAIKIDGLE
ncbi:MAG: DUF4403 family protein [Sphingobacteriaceae bacterium]